MNLFAWYWLIVVVSAVLYAALMLWFMAGWRSLTDFKPGNRMLKTKVAVIVPFFNEQANIQKCLKGIITQDIKTTEFQIYAVNDHSTDESVKCVEAIMQNFDRLHLLHNPAKGKKQALAYAIEQTNAELIVITDADCTYNSKWLSTLVDYYEQYKPGLIIGPVILEPGKGILQKFQLLEFNSLIMSTAGSAGIGHPVMCNGANLAFTKAAYSKLSDPFNLEYSSGDDVFLLHNMKKETDAEIHFLKSDLAKVKTQGAKGLGAFFKQRKRWVSKARGYTDGDALYTAFVVALVSILLGGGAILLIKDINFWKPALILFCVKLIIDSVFFLSTDSFFKHRKSLIYLVFFEIIYAGYVLTTTILALIATKKKPA